MEKNGRKTLEFEKKMVDFQIVSERTEFSGQPCSLTTVPA